jgi:hypothetical protein
MGWLRVRPVWVTLLLLLLWGGYEAHAIWSGERKLEDAGYGEGAAKASLAVTLAFPPEAFHLALLQQAGRLIRVEDRTAFLMGVPEPMARDLAERYWVEAIRPWSGA